MKAMSIVLLLCLVIANGFSFNRITGRRKGTLWRRMPEVWIEDADDGFVDTEENLEEGEVCHRAIKAFASVHGEDEDCFLCAGALVQRAHQDICDAWTADSMDGGPNLQLQGAIKILDDLFLFHLKNQQQDPISALRNFVLQCGAPHSAYSCASHMAGQARGFRPLKEMTHVTSIYYEEYYDNLDGMVFDYQVGKRLYEKVALTDEWEVAAEIWSFLPDEETIEAHIEVKEQEQDL